MLTRLDYYFRSRKTVKTTAKAHILRAKKILSAKKCWDREEAETWVYQRADEHEYSDSTINKWFQTFNHLNSCFEWGWAKGILRIKEKNRTRELLSLDETLDFYNLHTTEKYDLVIKLSITTGARPSEILTLRRWEVDVERQIIMLTHTKTKKDRILVIQDFLLDAVKTYLDKHDFARNDCLFFYKDKSKALSIESLEKEYRKRLAMLGITKHVTPYCMRHSYLTRMASQVNIAILQEMAGHSRVTTTIRYVHNNEYVIREASQKDFLFDDMRDWSVKINKIITDINTLAQNHSSQLDCVKLSEAVLCLRQAIKT